MQKHRKTFMMQHVRTGLLAGFCCLLSFVAVAAPARTQGATSLAATEFSPQDQPVAAASPLSAVADSNTVVVEVSGTVPGFTQAQLASFLARKMQGEVAAPWHFVAGKTAEELPLNRVVWSFKSLRKVWGGGTHKGFPAPSQEVTYFKAEAKLYLKDAYQMTMDTHPSVSSGDNDGALSEIVHNVSSALFAKNIP